MNKGLVTMVQSSTTRSDLPSPSQGLKTSLRRYCIPLSARWGHSRTLYAWESRTLNTTLFASQASFTSLYKQNQIVYTTFQILESWIHVAQQMLKRVAKRVIELVKAQKFEKAASDYYLIERIWKLFSETEFLLVFGFFCVCVCFFFFFFLLGWQERSIVGFVCVSVFVFLCLVDKKWQENPGKFRCVFLIFKFGFVFIVWVSGHYVLIEDELRSKFMHWILILLFSFLIC